MPTYDLTARFHKDLGRLTPEEREAFARAVERFVADLRRADGFRPGLRVKGVRGAPGVYEMTWAPDGRATFQYGAAVRAGEPHVVWRRVGTHDVLTTP